MDDQPGYPLSNQCLAGIYKHADFVHGGSGRSTVARIAINILRLMNMVAWLRSLDDWLMEESVEVLQPLSTTRKLLSCPNISPMEDISLENVKDGVVSRFNLTITDEDFSAVLNQADVLYRHASYIMTLLPEGNSEKHELSPKQKFLNDLPIEFSRQEAVELATQYDLSLSSMDKLLGRMIKNGELIKTAHGCYQFRSEYNKK